MYIACVTLCNFLWYFKNFLLNFDIPLLFLIFKWNPYWAFHRSIGIDIHTVHVYQENAYAACWYFQTESVVLWQKFFSSFIRQVVSKSTIQFVFIMCMKFGIERLHLKPSTNKDNPQKKEKQLFVYISKNSKLCV